MGLKEKLEARKQRKEALAFFRENNDQFFDSETWIKMIVIGVVLALVLGAVNAFITILTSLNLGIVIAIFGILISNILKKLAGTGNSKVAIVACVCYFIMLVFSNMIYIFVVGLGSSFVLLKFLSPMYLVTSSIKMIFQSGIIGIFIYAFGLYYTIMYAIND